MKKFIKKFIGEWNYELLRRRKRYIGYKGEDYECPVCNYKISKFLPGGLDFEVIRKYEIVGAGYFEEMICPVCESYNRDRLALLFLQKNTNLFHDNLTLLHFAPEKGISFICKKFSNIDYLSADLGSPLADIKIDITAIPFENKSFDVIICNHVLEHVPDDIKAMSELFRVLKDNGWAVLQVPISHKLEHTFEDFSIQDPREKEKYFGQNDHVRIYGLDYVDRLRSCGFMVQRIPASTFLSISEIKKYAVIENEEIFLCKKV